MSNDGTPPPSNPYGGSDQSGQPDPYGQPQGGQGGQGGGYGQPQGGQGGAYGQPQQSQGKGLAIAALIVGIFALLFSWTLVGGILLGLIAIVLGAIGSSKAKKGTAGGRGMAITGLVLGALGLLIAVGIIVVAALFLNSDTVTGLQDCLEQAGTDAGAQAQCQEDFANDLGGNN